MTDVIPNEQAPPVEFRAGQRVRIQWPDGAAVEDVLMRLNSTMMTRRHRVFAINDYGGDGREISVLYSPNPPEPTGLGAVVVAIFKSAHLETGRMRWVRSPDALRKGRWQSENGRYQAQWMYLRNVEILTDGIEIEEEQSDE